MRKRVSFSGIFMLLVLSLSLAACQSESDVTVVKLGHGLDPVHPVHRGMVFMAEKVAEKSGGKMRVDIYPSQQLGTERELLELLQLGSLGMTKVTAAVLESFAPSYKAFSVPYLFKDRDHHFRVLEGEIGKELLEASQEYWLLGLAYYDAGSRSFYTIDKQITHPADLAGLKIRTLESKTQVDMVNTMGGAATPISWGELYTALQSGVVDGAENNPPSFYTSRQYEVCKYYTLDEHTTIPDVLLISTIVWETLTPQEQAWLKEAAAESAQYQKKLWQEASDAALDSLAANGIEILIPDKQPFVESVAPIYESFKNEPEVYDLIQRIRAVGLIMLKVKNAVDKMLEWTLVVSMSLLVIDVLWQVFSRFILQDPSSFTEELARFLLIWVGLLGGAYAAGQRMHLAVDLLPNKLEGKKKAYLDIFIYITIVVFSIAVMMFGGSRLVAITLYLGQTAAALQMPLGYVYLILPLSGFLIAFYALLHLVDEFRILSGQPALFAPRSPLDSSAHLDVD